MEESEIIDKYLRGELDAEQAASFSKRLESDRGLQNKVALRKLVISGISQSYAEELKAKLAALDHSLENKKRLHFIWKMAAVFVMLIVGGWALYLTVQKPNPVYFDFYEPGLPNTMGSNDQIALSNAMNIFKTGDYRASSQEFEKLLIQNPKSDTLLYFAGLCDFKNGETTTAIQKWNKVASESVFFFKAEYRLAIAHWSIGNEKKAIELLQKIMKETSNPLHEQAQKALESLNKK